MVLYIYLHAVYIFGRETRSREASEVGNLVLIRRTHKDNHIQGKALVAQRQVYVHVVFLPYHAQYIDKTNFVMLYN